MKKRVSLARAIAMEPEILLYDEPTTGIDPIMADAINDLIIQMKEKLNVTSIAITHDMKSAYKIADRIAMLYQGKIIEVGTPEEIKNSSNPIVQQFIQGKSEGPIKMCRPIPPYLTFSNTPWGKVLDGEGIFFRRWLR